MSRKSIERQRELEALARTRQNQQRREARMGLLRAMCPVPIPGSELGVWRYRVCCPFCGHVMTVTTRRHYGLERPEVNTCPKCWMGSVGWTSTHNPF